MKTYKQFQEAVALAAPLLAPAAATFVAGAAANVLKATSRKPAVQRPSGKITAAEKQKRQAREDRRAQAADRARERAEQGIDALLGTDAERKAAAEARANQRTIQRDLRRKATRERMQRAAERNNLPEAVSKSDKLLGRLKMLYNLPSDKEKYFKQQNPPEVDRLKKAQVYPAPYTNKGLIDPRSEEQRAEDRMKSVKGAGYAIKWNPTLEKGFKLP